MSGGIFKKVLLILLGLLLFTVLLEAALQTGGFIFSSLQEYKNADSMVKSGECRILCLGESTTAGGVDPYPQQLEKVLNAGGMKIRFTVINGGVRSVFTSYIVSHLDDNLNKYKPQIVVVMMGINDYGRHMPYSMDEFEKLPALLKGLKVYKAARFIWLNLSKTSGRKPGPSFLERSLRDVLRADPGNTAVSERLAWFYQGQGKYGDARVLLRETAKAAHGKTSLVGALAPLYMRIGMLYRELEWFSTEPGVYETATEGMPLAVSFKEALGGARGYKSESAWLYAELGRLYVREENYEQARANFESAIKSDPEDGTAYRELGWLYVCQGQYAKAEGMLKESIEKDNGDYLALIYLGNLYLRQGEYPLAEQMLKKSIENNGGRSYGQLLYKRSTYMQLGWFYSDKGMREEARECFKNAASLDIGEDDSSGSMVYHPETVANFHKIKETLDNRGVKLVCVQYPMRSIKPLEKIFEGETGIVFVDNEGEFKDALGKSGYNEYFTDMFAGDFGHCTSKGNRLIAENIANAILSGLFGK